VAKLELASKRCDSQCQADYLLRKTAGRRSWWKIKKSRLGCGYETHRRQKNPWRPFGIRLIGFIDKQPAKDNGSERRPLHLLKALELSLIIPMGCSSAEKQLGYE